MAFQWKIYGKPVEKLWTICGTCMEHDCSGKAMVNLRKTNGLESQWNIYGESMGNRWNIYGNSMEKMMAHLWKNKWNICGKLMKTSKI